MNATRNNPDGHVDEGWLDLVGRILEALLELVSSLLEVGLGH